MNKADETIMLGHVNDLAEGSSKGFPGRAGEQDLFFLVKVGGQVYGWRNACPHIAGAPMAWRKDAYLNAQRSHITCYAHGALFDPKTGVCIQGPCLGKTLTQVAVDVSEAGQISVSLADIHHYKNKES